MATKKADNFCVEISQKSSAIIAVRDLSRGELHSPYLFIITYLFINYKIKQLSFVHCLVLMSWLYVFISRSDNLAWVY